MRFIPLAAAAAAFIAGAAVAQTTPHTVYFALGSDRIDAQGQQVIDAAAADFRSAGAASLDIVGHTDTTGSSAVNEALSRRRASAVAEALSDRGVPPDAIDTSYRGQDSLAVPTGDGVAEQRNRRVEITFAQPEPEPAPAPPPAAEPQRGLPGGLAGVTFGVGPYVAYNMEKDEESYFVGANFTATAFATPNVAVGLEQAVFYNLDADDEGWGGRSALGADFHFVPYGQGERVLPYVGANLGYTYIDGTGTGGFFAGPEFGVDVFGFKMRIAYDMMFAEESRSWDEGVLSATVGYVLHF